MDSDNKKIKIDWFYPKRIVLSAIWEDQFTKNPIQWIYIEWVRKLGSNELGNNYNGFRWQENKDRLVLSKENRPQCNLRRSVLIYITWIGL